MINRKTNIIHVFLRHVLPAIEELSEGRAREINARTLVRFRALFQAGKCSSVRAFISQVPHSTFQWQATGALETRGLCLFFY